MLESKHRVTSIRPLASKDTKAVHALLRATGNFCDAELTIAQDLMEIVLAEPHQTDYFAFIAEVEENVVGFLVLGPTPATAGTWDLYWIAAAPTYYGTGVAQTLEEHAEALVRQRSGYWLIAQTSSQPSYDRSQAFYRKQGYQSLARISDYYAPGDDLIMFGKRLEPNALASGACDI